MPVTDSSARATRFLISAGQDSINNIFANKALPVKPDYGRIIGRPVRLSLSGFSTRQLPLPAGSKMMKVPIDSLSCLALSVDRAVLNPIIAGILSTVEQDCNFSMGKGHRLLACSEHL